MYRPSLAPGGVTHRWAVVEEGPSLPSRMEEF